MAEPLIKISQIRDISTVSDQANAAYTQANAAYAQANTVYTQANAAYAAANTKASIGLVIALS